MLELAQQETCPRCGAGPINALACPTCGWEQVIDWLVPRIVEAMQASIHGMARGRGKKGIKYYISPRLRDAHTWTWEVEVAESTGRGIEYTRYATIQAALRCHPGLSGALLWQPADKGHGARRTALVPAFLRQCVEPQPGATFLPLLTPSSSSEAPSESVHHSA